MTKFTKLESSQLESPPGPNHYNFNFGFFTTKGWDITLPLHNLVNSLDALKSSSYNDVEVQHF